MKNDNIDTKENTLNERIYPDDFLAKELKRYQLNEIDNQIKRYDNMFIISSILSCLLFLSLIISQMPFFSLVLGILFGLHAFRSYNFREHKKSSYAMMEEFYKKKNL